MKLIDLFLDSENEKKFKKLKTGVLLIFNKYHYSILLPEQSACSLNYINILIKNYNEKIFKTNVKIFFGKIIIYIEDYLYENISIKTIKYLEQSLKYGILESYIFEKSILKQLKILINNFGGINENIILNTCILNDY